MDDLIRRQVAIEALLEKGQRSRRYKLGETWELNFDEIREALATVPSAEPKKGKWIEDCACSECGWCNEVEGGFVGSTRGWNFCPNCGANMRESE